MWLFERACLEDMPAGQIAICIYLNNIILLMGFGDQDSDAGLTSEVLSWWAQPHLTRRKNLSITAHLLLNKQLFSDIRHKRLWEMHKV